MPPELTLEPVSKHDEQSASSAVDAPNYLEKEPEVAALLSQCAESHTVGLDTEFVRERTFYARPGLVQVSDGEIIGLIDAVTVPDSPALGSLLGNRDVVKVLHSVGEDLEILRAVGGQWPEPLFDTQVAAALLGQPLQLRYEHLVASALGVELEGGKARNDWCRRPLAPALLRYAAEDVIWLPRLKDHLEAELERAGRLAWHREDCARMVERAKRGDTTPPLSRVKGAGRLSTPQLAFLDALAEWRETMAQARDLPRRFVISDESLIDLAVAASENGLSKAVSALPAGQRKRYAPSLEERVASVDPTGFERPDWIDPLSQAQREQLKKAQQAVRQVAEELDVEPALIASKKELTRLLRGECPDWLEGWRGEVLEGRLKEASVSISALRG